MFKSDSSCLPVYPKIKFDDIWLVIFLPPLPYLLNEGRKNLDPALPPNMK